MTKAPYSPMLAMPSTAQSGRQPISLAEIASRKGWVAEQKLDGLRCLVESDGNSCRLWNRSGKDITERFPEVARLRLPAIVLDGEIIAKDGLFSTALTRDKQTAGFDRAAKDYPCKYVAFDLLRCEGNDLTRQAYRTRRTLLQGILGRRRALTVVRQSHDILGLWKAMLDEGGEGIVVKTEAGLYLPGERASSWIKFKTVKRLTAIAIGRQKTNGDGLSIHLALLDGAHPVVVGHVGTGWSGPEEKRLRKRLDDGEQFLVEIEALNRTVDGVLRFPSYLGERNDLPLTAASADQLLTLPVY